jgi:hypothetical protein
MHKRLSDHDLDIVITRSLARLPHERPSAGFTSRVMDRVQLPPARALVLFRRARSWAAQPRRAAALAGSYAVMAAVTLGIVVPWITANAAAIRFAFGWGLNRIAAFGGEIGLGIAGWAVNTGLADALRSVPLSGASVWVAAGLLITAYAGCAVGLHLLLRAPKDRQEPVNNAA